MTGDSIDNIMFFEVPDWKGIGKPVVLSPKMDDENSLKNVPKTKEILKKNTNITSIKNISSSHKKEQPAIKIVKAQIKSMTKMSKAQQRLAGSRFRFLNQKLYQSTSTDAMSYFRENPDDFVHYHHGFKEQTKAWPQNPVNFFIDLLLKENVKPLEVADIGCGEGMLHTTLKDASSPHNVHSFDLVSLHSHIISANMTSLPLQSSSIDLAIFSLSLMNVDHSKALQEAFRILKPQGKLWIAEVSSRLGDHSISSFCKMLKLQGFEIQKIIDDNRVFFTLLLVKNEKIKVKKSSNKTILQACLYKKR